MKQRRRIYGETKNENNSRRQTQRRIYKIDHTGRVIPREINTEKMTRKIIQREANRKNIYIESYTKTYIVGYTME